ncbi:uncharacterized protein LOC132881756 [Neoarius graeffei]|uniref:uncharacterized protein LOC132881756 n=1 Tax=Neoarius graeffei TaxID=443677 RepID=UPI00298CE77D|nr:uncharacterized protein LOC132881756 [Neoarius graeffei]XP_060770595.1 uncharacterized protein LOC132881756 [Neoarius graeffei]XP_060770605.1 uncharacterized protein LOC132881756 [Neoarius graeffei]XP_060770614.1 uncharacterized protein LOC132881756 [Neoarius graeffei]XP_060770623.1 uncharacterized protein LOC132881756 [Neoarius graeffei]XP_060770632.1 uncharacterized protein LOC132881756 [Neoarius graeffei]
MACRLQEASEVLRDIIKKSQLISSSPDGPPARYHLLATKCNLDQDRSVRKWTFGQQDKNMQNKILLLVGETGTGKTTLINVVVNYILGVKFIDEVWFEITEEGENNQTLDQTETQTTQITVYEVFAQDNPICLTIIDTPGYGDTRGTDMDKQIAENLYKLFRNDNGVKEIDAVCLVVKASENRLSDRQHYIFDAVLSLFGKDIENNIVIFVTHSDGMPPTNVINAIKRAGIPCRKDEENEPECFLFNNRQSKKRSQKYNKPLQAAWEMTEDTLNDFFVSLKEENRKSLEQTDKVLAESKRLEACISNLQNRIDFVECKTKELAQIQEALEANREKMKRNENFTFEVTTYYKEKVLIENVSWKDRKATSCSQCEENCHEYGCWAARNASWCEVMKNNHCTSCTGKCHYTKHVKENKKYVRCSRQTRMTYDDLKKRFEIINNSASNIKCDLKSYENVKKELESDKKQDEEMTSIEKRLKEEITKKEKEKADLVEEAHNAIMKLSEIALKSDSAFIVQGLDFLIPRAEETGRDVLANNLRELRKIKPESEERVNAAAGYARAGLNKMKNFFWSK